MRDQPTNPSSGTVPCSPVRRSRGRKEKLDSASSVHQSCRVVTFHLRRLNHESCSCMIRAQWVRNGFFLAPVSSEEDHSPSCQCQLSSYCCLNTIYVCDMRSDEMPWPKTHRVVHRQVLCQAHKRVFLKPIQFLRLGHWVDRTRQCSH